MPIRQRVHLRAGHLDPDEQQVRSMQTGSRRRKRRSDSGRIRGRLRDARATAYDRPSRARTHVPRRLALRRNRRRRAQHKQRRGHRGGTAGKHRRLGAAPATAQARRHPTGASVAAQQSGASTRHPTKLGRRRVQNQHLGNTARSAAIPPECGEQRLHTTLGKRQSVRNATSRQRPHSPAPPGGHKPRTRRRPRRRQPRSPGARQRLAHRQDVRRHSGTDAQRHHDHRHGRHHHNRQSRARDQAGVHPPNRPLPRLRRCDRSNRCGHHPADVRPRQ